MLIFNSCYGVGVLTHIRRFALGLCYNPDDILMILAATRCLHVILYTRQGASIAQPHNPSLSLYELPMPGPQEAQTSTH